MVPVQGLYFKYRAYSSSTGLIVPVQALWSQDRAFSPGQGLWSQDRAYSLSTGLIVPVQGL